MDKGKCSICLDFIKSEQGMLDCHHNQFCFTCISNWSKFSNKCPLCMKKFTSITNLSTKISLIVDEVASSSEEEQFEDSLDEVICQVCKLGNYEDILMLCDGCDFGFHTTCIGLIRIPYLEYWFCDECIKTQPDDIRSLQTQEITTMRQSFLPRKRSRQALRTSEPPQLRVRRSERLKNNN
jgi:Ring finger domain/PHD-finger